MLFAWRVVHFGANANNSGKAGSFALNANNTWSNANTNIKYYMKKLITIAVILLTLAGTAQTRRINPSGSNVVTKDVKGNVEIDGKLKTISFQMPTGAVNGYLLQSDNQGNASWVDHQITYPGAGIVTSTGTGFGNSITDNSVNWNAAYGWGDHSQAGYLLGETDPVFSNSPAAGITSGNINSWNTAYNWGNHANAGYLTSHLWTEDTNGITFNSNVGIGIASSTAYRLLVSGGIRGSSITSLGALSINGLYSNSGEVIFDSKPNQAESMFSFQGALWMDSDDNKLYFTNTDGTYDLTAGGGGTTYNGWILHTNGTNRGTISDGEVVNFAAGSNMSLSYNSTNNTITFNSSSSGGESLWASDANGINYSVSGKNVGIGGSSVSGYALSVDRSLAGWAGRFRNTHSTSSHGLEIVTGNTSGSYNAIQLANSQGAIMYMRNAGNMRFHKYGQGNFGGTVAKYLAVDSNGNVIESDGTGGGGSGTPGGSSGSVQYNNGGVFAGFGNYNGSRMRIDNRLSVYSSISSYPYMHLIADENISYLGWNSSDASSIQGGFEFDVVGNLIKVTGASFKPTTITDANNSTGAVGHVLTRTSTGVAWQSAGSTSGGWTDTGTDVVLTTPSDRVVIGDDNVNKLEALYVNTDKNHGININVTDSYGEGLIARAIGFAGMGVVAEGDFVGVMSYARGTSGVNYGGYFVAQENNSGIGIRIDATRAHFLLSDIMTVTPPANSTDTGIVGEVRVTTDYIYVCVATNTWKRVALSSW